MPARRDGSAKNPAVTFGGPADGVAVGVGMPMDGIVIVGSRAAEAERPSSQRVGDDHRGMFAFFTFTLNVQFLGPRATFPRCWR